MKKALFLLLFICTTMASSAAEKDLSYYVFLESLKKQLWIEAQLSAMSLEERLGQVFMIRAHTDLDDDHIQEVVDQIKKYHVGGVIFFQGHPMKQALLTNRYQSLSKLPLMVSIDAEWGLGMRLPESTISYPQQLLMGAIRNNQLIYDFGKEVARQCKRIGVQVNLAPVVDVNNNPNNPVINSRSFGEEVFNVTAKSYMYMKGMQDAGVFACAKHFPGHGDTDVDSHFDLPVIKHNRDRLDSIELFPFKVLSKHGLGSLMTAHLAIPALDDRPNMPISLSEKVVDTLLRQEIGFDGLIFTDGLEMKGVTKHYNPGQVAVKAFNAGNDILLLPDDMDAAFAAMKKALDDGTVSKTRLGESLKRILGAKYDLGLTTTPVIDTTNLMKHLHTKGAYALKERILEAGMTAVRNQDFLIPIRGADTLKKSIVVIGSKEKTIFQENMTSYSDFTEVNLPWKISSAQSSAAKTKISKSDLVVILLDNMSQRSSKNFGISPEARKFISSINKKHQVILVALGNPYSLKYFDEINHVVLGYHDNDEVHKIAAKALFGQVTLNGRLPITASKRSISGSGVSTHKLYKLSTAEPEVAGMLADSLDRIDKLVKEAIKKKAMPGGQILVAKNNKIVFHKAYGHHSTRRRQKVKTEDIYDLASLTKILATTLAVMKMHEDSLININDPIGKHLPFLRGSNKDTIPIRQILAHHGKLKPWIPFYHKTLTDSKRKRPKKSIYHKSSSEKFTRKVANKMYISDLYSDSIWSWIKDSDLRTANNYRYSDLGFILFSRLVKEVTGSTLDNYVKREFYQPLGLSTMMFNPLEKFDDKRITPSEKDNYFRMQTIDGYVHDMGAAMMGGVSGHAGLFSNAKDIAVIMQMLLNNGFYENKKFFKKETIELFTTRYTNSTRRGLGFDMLELDSDKEPNLSTKASSKTFGHLGFTGTAVWADPDEELIFVFLSNRTYPTMKNNRLGRDNYRPRLQDLVYGSLDNNPAIPLN